MWMHLFPTLNKVGISVCIRDDEGRFLLAKAEWFTLIVDVDVGKRWGS